MQVFAAAKVAAVILSASEGSFFQKYNPQGKDSSLTLRMTSIGVKARLRKNKSFAPNAGAKLDSRYHPDYRKCGISSALNAGRRSGLSGKAREWLSVLEAGSFSMLAPLCGILRRLVPSQPVTISSCIVSEIRKLSSSDHRFFPYRSISPIHKLPVPAVRPSKPPLPVGIFKILIPRCHLGILFGRMEITDEGNDL